MTAKIERDHRSVATKFTCDRVPPMGVGPPAMEQDHGRLRDLSPVKGSKKDTVTTRMCESLYSGFHWARTLPVPLRLLNAPGQTPLLSKALRRIHQTL